MNKHECPCRDCIVLAACMVKVKQQHIYTAMKTTDYPFVVRVALSPDCDIINDWLLSHPREHYEYETSYMTELIDLMKLRGE